MCIDTDDSWVNVNMETNMDYVLEARVSLKVYGVGLAVVYTIYAKVMLINVSVCRCSTN